MMARCDRCDRPMTCDRVYPESPSLCYGSGGRECYIHAVDWRARALAEKQRADEAEANAASWERLHDLACQNVAHANEEGESAREYIGWSSRKHRDAESIARRALVEGLAEATKLRKLVPYQLPTSDEAQAMMDDLMRANRPQPTTRTVLSRRAEAVDAEMAYRRGVEHGRADAARAERERWAAWFDTRVAFCREQQQAAASERQFVVADQFGRLAAEREQTAAVLRSNNIPSANNGDHAKGGG